MLQHEVKHTGVSRGKRGRGCGRGGGRTGSVQSLKFEDDVEDVSPESSRSPSFENVILSHDEKPKCFQEHNSHSSTNSGLKVRNFDLNVELEENEDSEEERRLEGSRGWSFLGMKEMKIGPYQQASSANEEDYDEESIDEE